MLGALFLGVVLVLLEFEFMVVDEDLCIVSCLLSLLNGRGAGGGIDILQIQTKI